MIPYAATAVVAAAVGFGSAWWIQEKSYDAQLSKIHAQHATALADAHQKALDDTIKLQRTKDDAIKQAEQRAKQNAASAAAARADADSLRAQLASVQGRIASATDSAVREYANAASVVFAECVRSYQEMAGKADGHANDARLMLEAWPK